MNIDSASFFSALADEMNAHPDQFLGDADMVAALVLRKDGGDFAVKVTFEADAPKADYYLDGPLSAWQAMFDDILEHGAASGRMTINSLALLATDIRLRGTDPMGTDKFSRFNQSLQVYLDGAARTAVAAG